MKSVILHILFLLLATTPIHARTWTDTKGKTIEAMVVKVNPNKTVKLKTTQGKVVTVPFSTFAEKDIQYLEGLLLQEKRGALHEVPWSKLNEIFKVPVWKDAFLWDDSTAETGKRMGLNMESRTDFMENYRSYPLGRGKILNEPVYAVALYGGATCADSISFIFLNQGDIPRGTDPDEIADQIEESGTRIHDQLTPLLGEPERDSLGKGDLREKVWRWDWNSHALMLSIQDGKYTALRIMPTDRADRSGRIAKLKDDALKKRMGSCVERRPNGDVIIGNIPMIDQGPKGYCAPATWERYLRYMDIPVDMYLLALAADTSQEGTTSQAMFDATGNIISSNGRKLSTSDTTLTLKSISMQINKGLPIMWSLYSTPSFQKAANDATAKRKGVKIGPSGQVEDQRGGGHLCLIIGYNKTTEEVAISDSWGTKFAERWVSLSAVQEASTETREFDGEKISLKRSWSIIKW